jgi:hypothetical protein
VQLKTIKIAGLSSGWCDKDEVLLHATFQILVDFVRDEEPERKIDWSHDREHRHAWREIESLYSWWTKKRPARGNPLDTKGLKHPPRPWKKIPGSDLWELTGYDKKKYADFERASKEQLRMDLLWYREDQRMLHRLVDVRQHLWT